MTENAHKHLYHVVVLIALGIKCQMQPFLNSLPYPAVLNQFQESFPCAVMELNPLFLLIISLCFSFTLFDSHCYAWSKIMNLVCLTIFL